MYDDSGKDPLASTKTERSAMCHLDKYNDLVEWIDSRAVCSDWSKPETPSDYMAWFLDEMEIQLAQPIAKDTPEEVVNRIDFVQNLLEAVNVLRKAGVTPGRLPWEERTHG